VVVDRREEVEMRRGRIPPELEEEILPDDEWAVRVLPPLVATGISCRTGRRAW
jgi:hypothetical protein